MQQIRYKYNLMMVYAKQNGKHSGIQTISLHHTYLHCKRGNWVDILQLLTSGTMQWSDQHGVFSLCHSHQDWFNVNQSVHQFCQQMWHIDHTEYDRNWSKSPSDIICGVDGYDEKEKLVFLIVFKHMKNIRLFSGHVQQKYNIWKIQKQFSFIHLIMTFILWKHKINYCGSLIQAGRLCHPSTNLTCMKVDAACHGYSRYWPQYLCCVVVSKRQTLNLPVNWVKNELLKS